ncbi:calcium/sodium antiporter [Marilutibacter alkalisoli]|uniref:Calcium/sodium antiporter n=1 Tax=Marilutibacter alkalisoli TaxID=2591633 RepID=A0A514BNW2_9GAMM|nr:calcium/sodium antiporter [Lysobacter alkalisoli]QDH69060.1 calcium/sodium antiporter [Lysobacter alkalisoli]
MNFMVALWMLIGFAVLVGGAELLVRGASRIALATGLSPLVVGLTVVAFGTSAPELATSIGAALQGAPDIAIGNVVGSNIANVLLVLGIAALVMPLVVARQLIWLDVPLLVVISGAVWLMALDHEISRVEGGALILVGIAYTVLLIWMSRRGIGMGGVEDDLAEMPRRPLWFNLLLLVVGLVLLVLGARLLVSSAVSIAQALGVSQLIIGLTVIAIGTSLPEIATSVLAVARGQRDLAAGNVIGSCIFNLLLVLGATAAVSPDGVPVSRAALNFDIPVMIATAVACLPIFFTGHYIARWEGGLFLGYYAAYLTYLVLQNTHHDALETFSTAMTWFVIPLTVVTLLVVMSHALRNSHNNAPPTP